MPKRKHEPIDVEDCLDYLLLSIRGYEDDEDVAVQPSLNRLAGAVGTVFEVELPVMPAGQVRAIIREARRNISLAER